MSQVISGQSVERPSNHRTQSFHLTPYHSYLTNLDLYQVLREGTHHAAVTDRPHFCHLNPFNVSTMKTPESVLKKQATQAKITAAREAADKAAGEKAVADVAQWTDKAKKYAEEYAAQEKAEVDNRRSAKAQGGFYVPAEPKLVIVVRIRGTIGVSPKAKKVMQLFRLRQLHNATFVRLNEATIRMLRLIEPYVTYGYPSRSIVEKLILKRGFGKLNKQRIPIGENVVIEEGLGKFGITCVPDLLHEIITVGPHFKQANNFLWPFKLNNPKGGFSRKTKMLHFMEGGEAGARGEEINTFIKKML